MKRFFTLAGIVAALVLMTLPAIGRAQLTLEFYARDEVDEDRDGLADGFNMAECEADAKMTFKYTYSGSLGAGNLDLWFGSSCDNKEYRDDGRCFAAFEDEYLDTSGMFDIDPEWVIDYESDPPACVEAEGETNMYLFVMADDADETILYSVMVTIAYDTDPPDPPVDIASAYGESKAEVSWDVADEDRPEDFDKFAILCFPPPSDETTDDASTEEDGNGGGGAEPDDVVDDTDLVETLEDIEADDELIEDMLDDEAQDIVEDDPGAGEDPAADPAPDPTADSGSDTSSGDDCLEGGFAPGDPLNDNDICSGRLGQTTRSYWVEGLSNNETYKFGVVAYDTFKNPSVISDVVCATPAEVDDFWEHYKKSGGETPAEKFCFVATAAYGTPMHPFVGHLRNFRDEILKKFSPGRAFVRFYYEHSPPLAAAIEKSPAARTVVSAALLPVVALAWAGVAFVHHPELSFLLFGLVLLAGAIRWRKKFFASLLSVILACAALYPSAASAEKSSIWRKQEGSPQRFAAELKFGPYTPDIDAEFEGSTPYKDVFGSGSSFHGLFEFDWQFFRPKGVTLGVGGATGGFISKGKALDPDTGAESGEEVKLNVWPLHLDLVIRVDALLLYTVVPFVPYFKAGLSYYIWWTSDESGTSSFDGGKGYGGTFGWNIMAGLMFCLDVFEQTAARTFDNEVGVNNSYLFAEFMLARIDNFGNGERLNFSEMTWTAGLAVEF
ncbi:MAG: MXAN_2562 family outer membrane beta-barrel protein [Pseudomonadota bacterium]